MDPLTVLRRLLLGLIAAATLLAAAPAAHAETRLVTYAARVCNSYTDVTANLARNNIQESLRDLGADTLYTSGEPISVAKEAEGQPNCRPLPNWRFTLGTGYQADASAGSWGSMSAVTNPYDTSIVTETSTPLLDQNGSDTGQDLAGAVTVPLTDDQADRASSYSSLWAQGGKPDDPVLDQVYPGKYGFAALRCSVDNLNGDNVEYITYPQGVRHVFCYAYYVSPPPESGTIVVRKHVDDPAATADQAFPFSGNISYNPDGGFEVSASYGKDGSETFYRAATGSGQPWTFTEDPPPGWTLADLSCTSSTGASTTATNVSTGATAVRLAAGDVVTCTYTNRLVPPKAGLVISKRTLGGVGRFGFDIRGPQNATRHLQTTAPGDWVSTPRLDLDAGAYTITERKPPTTVAGRWALVRAVCDGKDHSPTEPVKVALAAGDGANCGFVNTLIPRGSITLRKRTIGSTGKTGFVVYRVRDPRRYEQTATTTPKTNPARAKGDSTAALRLGTYAITETGTTGPKEGTWQLYGVVCDGKPIAASAGRFRLRLTADNPHVDCTFTNRFFAAPEPPRPPVVPPGPTPTPPGGGGTEGVSASGPFAGLRVTKSVSPHRVRLGHRAHYRIVVTNRGPRTAYDVVANEFNRPVSAPLHLRTTRGHCRGTRPAFCRLGNLRPGAKATITVSVVERQLGRFTNRVGVVTSSNDPFLPNNVDSAVVTVIPPLPPRFTG